MIVTKIPHMRPHMNDLYKIARTHAHTYCFLELEHDFTELKHEQLLSKHILCLHQAFHGRLILVNRNCCCSSKNSLFWHWLISWENQLEVWRVHFLVVILQTSMWDLWAGCRLDVSLTYSVIHHKALSGWNLSLQALCITAHHFFYENRAVETDVPAFVG